ncbi:MAG: LapA family protein [bacterium]|nr:LapA family protein [bacterium]
MIITLIMGLVLGAISVIFITQNTDVISISFLQWQVESSVALIILGSLLMGALITSIFSLPAMIKSSMRLSRLSKDNRNLEKKVEDVKANSISTENKTIYVEQDLPERRV